MSESKGEYKTKKNYHDALDNVLDRPIAFNPSFKKITGSTNAALLLSQAFYWTKRTKDSEGWFWKTRDEWMEETGLTESELDGAREKCRSAGVIEEKLKGVPATLHYRVVKQKVYELLGFQIPENPESGIPKNTQIPEKQESEGSGDFNKESESSSETTSPPNENLAFLTSLYEKNIGMVFNGNLADELQEYSVFPKDWIERAFKEMADSNVRNWRYIRRCLDSWKQAGKITVKQNAIPVRPFTQPQLQGSHKL